MCHEYFSSCSSSILRDVGLYPVYEFSFKSFLKTLPNIAKHQFSCLLLRCALLDVAYYRTTFVLELRSVQAASQYIIEW
jgi:hypothetical protein